MIVAGERFSSGHGEVVVGVSDQAGREVGFDGFDGYGLSVDVESDSPDVKVLKLEGVLGMASVLGLVIDEGDQDSLGVLLVGSDDDSLAEIAGGDGEHLRLYLVQRVHDLVSGVQ